MKTLPKGLPLSIPPSVFERAAPVFFKVNRKALNYISHSIDNIEDLFKKK